MRNPEFAYARALGASAQRATLAVAEQAQSGRPRISFQVDLPPSAAEGANQVGGISTFTWVDERTPIAVLGICLGKLFLAATLDPLDPTTRAFMQDVNQCAALPFAITFCAGVGTSTSQAVQVVRSFEYEQPFTEVLRVTEGMTTSDAEPLVGAAAHAMAHCLLDEGFSERVRSKLTVRAFNVCSVEMLQESRELALAC